MDIVADKEAENFALKRNIEVLRFIVGPICYIETETTIKGVKYINIRGPCLQYQKKALKQIYKEFGIRKESIYQAPAKQTRVPEQINIFYGKNALYNSGDVTKLKSWKKVTYSLSQELLDQINFKQYGVLFSKDLKCLEHTGGNVSQKISLWLRRSTLD